MDPLDQFLAELKAEYTEAKELNNNSISSDSRQPKSLIDILLAEVKADFAAIDAAETLVKQQELIQENQRQEAIKAEKMAVLQNYAQAWLDKLDPFSAEGLWFTRLAESYPSQLAAAIDYLQHNLSEN